MFWARETVESVGVKLTWHAGEEERVNTGRRLVGLLSFIISCVTLGESLLSLNSSFFLCEIGMIEVTTHRFLMRIK